MKSIYLFLVTTLIVSCGQQPSKYKPTVSHPKPTSVLAPIMQGDFWGFIDTNGVIVIPAQFRLYQTDARSFPTFHEGLCVFVDPKSQSNGAIDSSGAWVIKPRFFELGTFSEGISSCQVCLGCRSVFVSKKDSMISYYDFQFVSSFSEGLASFEKNGLYGFINREGKVIIEPQFYSVLFFTEGYAMVDIGTGNSMAVEHISEFRFINKKGEILAPDQYDNADLMFMNGFAVVSKNIPVKLGEVPTTKQGLINRKGKLVVPLSFRFCFRNFFRDGLEFAIDYDDYLKGNRKMGLIDSTGKWLTQPIFEDAMAFAENVAPVKQNGKWGFIDEKGNMIITPQFDSVHDFREGLAAASVNGKYGFIDHSGKWVITPTYDDASYFKFGLAPVKLNFKYGYINRKGTWITEPEFERAGLFQNVNDESSNEIYYR